MKIMKKNSEDNEDNSPFIFQKLKISQKIWKKYDKQTIMQM